MRLSYLLPLLSLSSPLLAAPADATTAVEAEAKPSGTKFNGEEVPPLPELSGQTITDDIKQGYWLVEFFSPYCHHCKQQAPIWQTLYEFYYTLKPVQAASKSTSQSDKSAQDLNSFTRYYNYKFARIDCVAFGTACSDKKVESFPTIILFKDGKEVKKTVGTQDLATLSKWVEETLESIRPGSRPKEGPRLPTVGASKVDSSAKPVKPASKDKDLEAGKKAGEKHNAVASSASAAATASSFTTKTVAALPKETPNLAGKSGQLTAESFQKLVTTTRDPWFIKFYVPWCGHCQALAPNWQSMAREMKGVLNVGEVNCDVEKRLCKDARATAYPTLVFFRGGERVEYNGLRGVGDLTSFAKTAVDVGSGVTDVDRASFEKMEETEEVLFVYFYDHATTMEDFSALDRLTLSLIGHAKLLKTKDPQLAKRFKISTWPRLMVSRSGKPSYYSYLAPKDMRDFRKVLNWMKTVWQPIVPELTASNAREIMNGKVVVLGILSRDRSDEFVIAKREIKNAALEWMDREANAVRLERQELRDAKQLRIEEAEDRNDQKALRAAKAIRIKMDDIDRRDVGFAWVDGVFWERWIRTTFGIDVKDGERVVINDEENRRYWDQTSTGNPIVPSRTSILETLPKTISSPPKLTPKSSTSKIGHVIWSIRTTWSRHPWLSFIGLVGACSLAIVLGRKARKGNKGGVWLGMHEEKSPFGGILGSTGAGKVD